MWRTRVGYTGGTRKNPTYYQLGDHTESFQVEFDPEKISYERLLEIFWSSHNPCAVSGSRQYMSAVFYHNEAQRRLAEITRDRQAARLGRRITTPILPLREFYPAEDYHQKYFLRQHTALLKEFREIYPEESAFLRSTAAARVNGYLAGYGRSDALEKEIGRLGLSPAGQRLLRLAAKDRH